MLFHGINSRRQSWQLSCKASIICWRTGFSCRGRMCLSTKWRPRALMSTHLFLCPLLLQSKQHKGRGHLCLLISSSAQCHVYPLRSWLGWTVIKYALVHAQILAQTPLHSPSVTPLSCARSQQKHSTAECLIPLLSVTIYSNILWHYSSSS